MSGSGTLNIIGAIPETAIPLQRGWNLVGCGSLTPLNISDAMSSISAIQPAVWTFDAEINDWLSYNSGIPPDDLDKIEPGRGYWIYTPENCMWDISSR